MIGKTIAEIIDRGADYGGIDIVFTDGTALRIDGDGYETSTVTQTELSPEDLEREAVEAAEREVAQREAAARAAERAAEEAEIKASMSKEGYEAWMDEHRPGWRLRVMMQREIQGLYADMVRDVNRQLSGDGVGRYAVIPIVDRPDG